MTTCQCHVRRRRPGFLETEIHNLQSLKGSGDQRESQFQNSERLPHITYEAPSCQ